MTINKDDEIGALWNRQSARGLDYMSGRLTIDGQSYDVVAYWNSHKQDGERTPDLRLYKSQPRDGQQQPAQSPQPRRGPPQQAHRVERPSAAARDAAVQAQRPAGGSRQPQPVADDLNDEIPF